MTVRLGVLAAAGAALLMSAGVASAQATPQAPAMAPPAPRMEGYLGKDRLPNGVMILPPPPVAGSVMAKLDDETYTKTRALAGSERWALAARDAAQYISAFDCPLGFSLETAPPEVLTLIARVGRDASTMTNLPKDHYRKPRPFVASNGPICVENDRAGLMKSFSYPSGHATFSWALGLILAEMVPEHASEILARARAFGESRVVCGVHTVSDVEEGRTNGASLVAVLHSDPAFRADLETARTALRAAIAAPHTAPAAGQCRIEAAAEAHTPWINPTADK